VNVDQWHFPRTDLSNHYFKSFELGVATRIVLYAPRKMGKTEFLIYDLMPVATEYNYLPIYINLWKNKEAPHEVIIESLTVTLDSITNKGIKLVKKTLKGIINKLKISTEFGAEFSTSLEPVVSSFEAIKAPSNQLTYISKLIRELIKQTENTPILLIIDEVQHLSISKKFDPLTYNLRTIIDENRHRLFAVLTGSSRTGLRKLFSDSKSPLYRFADMDNFPVMGSEFVEHIGGVFKKVTGKVLDIKKANRIFKKFDYNPDYFRTLVRIMALHEEIDINLAYKNVIDLIGNDNEYKALFEKLNDIDLELIKRILGNHAIYSQDYMEKMASKLGETITRGKIQSRIKRLEKMNVITKNLHGDYLVETPGFIEWIKKTQR